ncbi:MAG: hypothetical protein Q7R22_015645 [Verrucomicrobiota bacterium JB025]|nr:hypothetical protein [Verrucomicrobiota bacterium JB025]
MVTTHFATNFDLDAGFTGDPEEFTLILTLDVSGLRISTLGLNNSTQVNLSGSWASLSEGGTDFTTALATDGPMFIAASIINRNFTGATLDTTWTAGDRTSGALLMNAVSPAGT